jgi:hypothetical protein
MCSVLKVHEEAVDVVFVLFGVSAFHAFET